ncbi:sialate O-acetylesterase [Capnocytophaga genosp. AHN8471]|uniref:Sialate O-acetylesterase n=1 Tax=Capnocytophaga genosp. AHN8471 TaxID=327574 RepID=A0ABS1YX68_9FLAO|nr:SGNH/GDSL hydrolase family protein [Capnocytophaga genosp. AHN8471]MBM0650628.1 sialate O-acetylesterase [Capnocytophaga genosp. AHN8471]MBM0661816.1 sialate O-acetylesterase [Capnocytophaga genosp. AHN8471]
MKHFLITLLAILFTQLSEAQTQKYSTFYVQRASLFSKLPITSKDIVFIGNSITNGAEWNELFPRKQVKNRGISGDTSEGVYDRLEPVVKGKPAKIFILIGINDISRGVKVEDIVLNMKRIVEKIQNESPKTKIYIQSILPVNPDFEMFKGHQKPQLIKEINQQYQNIAKEYKVNYIDLYSHFLEKGTDKMNKNYTNDGLHLLGEGYLLWSKIIKPYL